MQNVHNGSDPITKLYTDMYIGNGKGNPSITVRISLLEEGLERIDKNLNKITWLLVGVILTAIADVVIQVLKKGF